MTFDLAVVGAGIVGLAHALAGVRRGLKVAVIERDARPIGASIRNFGFVTITGQGRGETWSRAKRSAQVWAEVAPRADIEGGHRGLVVLAQRQEALPILEAFLATEMGEDCALLSAKETRARFVDLHPKALAASLWSPHEMRVESRAALPKLIAWLERQGVVFQFSTAARAAGSGQIETSRGIVRAGAIAVCPGDDLNTLFPEAIAQRGVTRCILQMLRLGAPAYRLPAAVMSDLSLVRYRGYSEFAESAPLRERLTREQGEHLEHGVHVIVVQSADGSLVVGDSHHYAPAPDPFAASQVEKLIISESEACLGVVPPVIERWTGTYSSAESDMFRAAPERDVRLVMVTSGTGASTAFAIAEETLSDLFGSIPDRMLP